MIANTKRRMTLLGSSAIVTLAAGPVAADEVDELKTQIDQLRARLEQIEKQTVAVGTQAASAPVDAVVGGDFPGSFKLPGSDTSIAIHGYTKLDFIYNFNARMGDAFVESSIPGNHNALSNTGPQVRLHARQSRLTLQTRTPTDFGQLTTFIQMDFFGSPSSAGGNNSSDVRVRQAYGTLGAFLGGQTWSNFGDTEDVPVTLDHQGPAGEISVRQAQARYTKSIGNWTLAGALENPAGEVGQVSDGTFTPAAPVSVGSGAPRTGANNVVDRMPDITGSAHYYDIWGHVQVAGVVRYFGVDDGGSSNNSLGATVSHAASAIGGGGLVGSTLNVGNWVGGAFAADQIGLQGFLGNGIDRYVKHSTRQGDAIDFITPTPTGGFTETIHTQTQYGGYIWVRHEWTDQLRSNFIFGVQKQDWLNNVPVTPTQIQQIESIHVNLIWSPVNSVSLGAECMFGSIERRNLRSGAGVTGGSKGEANGLQLSVEFLF